MWSQNHRPTSHPNWTPPTLSPLSPLPPLSPNLITHMAAGPSVDDTNTELLNPSLLINLRTDIGPPNLIVSLSIIVPSCIVQTDAITYPVSYPTTENR